MTHLPRVAGAAQQIKDVGSPRRIGLSVSYYRPAARRREVDAVVVWRLDRWGRSLPDLVVTLRELTDLGVGFVSLTEALDLTTPTGRAMAGMVAVFAEFEREILRERVRAGIVQARKEGRPPPRPAEDGIIAVRRSAPPQVRARESLRDRAAVGDRPHFRAAHTGGRLTTDADEVCAQIARASRTGFTGRTVRRSKPAKGSECKSRTGKTQPVILTPSHASAVVRPQAKR